jgi:MFS family permease
VKKRFAVVGLLGVLSVITFLDRMAIAVTGPSIQKELSITPEQWGWILGAYVIAYAVFEVPSGIMGDRHGYRKELVRITIWWSFFTAITAVCRNFWQLVGARFMFGLGAAGAYPNMSGVMSKWLPKAERARGQSVVWAASRFGGAMAPLLLVPLQAKFGWQSVFVALGVVGLMWAVVWHLWFRDKPAEQPGITDAELAEIGTPANGGHTGVPWAALLRLPQLWLIALAYGFYAWGSWFFFNWFPTWMVNGAHFSLAEMGLYGSIPFLLGIAANLIGGVLADRLVLRIGMKRAYSLITSVCLAITAVLLVAMSLTTDKVMIIILAAACFGVMDLMLPSAWAMCMNIGGQYGATATGVMNTAGNIGGFICTVVFGYVVSATHNYDLPVQAVAAMVLIAAVIFSRIDCTKTLPDRIAKTA